MNYRGKMILGLCVCLLGIAVGGTYFFGQEIQSIVGSHDQQLEESSIQATESQSSSDDASDLEVSLTATDKGGMVVWRDIEGDVIQARYEKQDGEEDTITFKEDLPPDFVLNELEEDIKEAHDFDSLDIQ